MRRWPWAAAVAVVGVSIAQLRTKRALPYAGKPCTAAGCRPSFLIIGIGKCGTSSLYYYLAAHPSVMQARRKCFRPKLGHDRRAIHSTDWSEQHLTHTPRDPELKGA